MNEAMRLDTCSVLAVREDSEMQFLRPEPRLELVSLALQAAQKGPMVVNFLLAIKGPTPPLLYCKAVGRRKGKYGLLYPQTVHPEMVIFFYVLF